MCIRSYYVTAHKADIRIVSHAVCIVIKKIVPNFTHYEYIESDLDVGR